MAKLTFTVPASADGMRVDEFFRKMLPDLPESVLRKIFAARDVRLDQFRVPREALIRAGQVMGVYCPDAFCPEPAASLPSAGKPDAASAFLDVVYEDADVLLVNKRPNFSVEEDAGGGITLTDLCRMHVRSGNPDAFPPAACHRLDHRTSGLCLFAKTPEVLEVLQDVFRRRSLDKEYVCLVRGQMKPPRAVCRAWLLKDARKGRVTVLDREAPGAKQIITEYETLEGGPVSRLRVHLVTGRTHQIRAHLAALGHPILGDDLYGDREFNRVRKIRWLKLCAVSLTLDTGGRLPDLDHREFRIEPPF